MATRGSGALAGALAGLALLTASCAGAPALAPHACGSFGLGARAACGAGVVAPVVPPAGLLYSSYRAPLENQFSATPVGTKQGRAAVRYLQDPIFTRLPIITFGDASIDAAAAEGGISTIRYVDYELLSVAGIFVELEVVVSGD